MRVLGSALRKDDRGLSSVELMIVVAVVGLLGVGSWRLLGAAMEDELEEQGELIARIGGTGGGPSTGMPSAPTGFGGEAGTLRADADDIFRSHVSDPSNLFASTTGPGTGAQSDVPGIQEALDARPDDVPDVDAIEVAIVAPESERSASNAYQGPFSSAAAQSSHYLDRSADWLEDNVGLGVGSLLAGGLDAVGLAFRGMGASLDSPGALDHWLNHSEDPLGDVADSASRMANDTDQLLRDPYGHAGDALDQCTSSLRSASTCGWTLAAGAAGGTGAVSRLSGPARRSDSDSDSGDSDARHDAAEPETEFEAARRRREERLTREELERQWARNIAESDRQYYEQFGQRQDERRRQREENWEAPVGALGDQYRDYRGSIDNAEDIAFGRGWTPGEGDNRTIDLRIRGVDGRVQGDQFFDPADRTRQWDPDGGWTEVWVDYDGDRILLPDGQGGTTPLTPSQFGQHIRHHPDYQGREGPLLVMARHQTSLNFDTPDGIVDMRTRGGPLAPQHADALAQSVDMPVVTHTGRVETDGDFNLHLTDPNLSRETAGTWELHSPDVRGPDRPDNVVTLGRLEGGGTSAPDPTPSPTAPRPDNVTPLFGR